MRGTVEVGDDAERPRQVSVAELLAQYGHPEAGQRRRRRAVTEDAPSAPAPPTEEPESTSVPEPPVSEIEPAATETQPVVETVAAGAEPDEDVASHTIGVAALLVELLAAVAVGAALWLGFRWLWGEWPVVALVLALLVSVGSVVAVRLAHRVEDALSMLLALGVGLVVTMSPAALALVGA